MESLSQVSEDAWFDQYLIQDDFHCILSSMLPEYCTVIEKLIENEIYFDFLK